MAEFVAQIQNQENWIIFYDETRTVATNPDGSYVPFPAFEIPILFDRPLLAVRCLVAGAPSSWRFAGNLTQRFPIGSGGSESSFPVVDARRVPLRVNRSELHYFSMLTDHYELILENPYWLQNLRLTIWQFVGEVKPLTETVINTVVPQLGRIEAAVSS